VQRLEIARGMVPQLAVRVHKPFAAEQEELMLCRRWVDMRKDHAMKCKVPGGWWHKADRRSSAGR